MDRNLEEALPEVNETADHVIFTVDKVVMTIASVADTTIAEG